MLMRILQESNLEIQVAVVLSCHSEYIGQIFLKAGIKHVICVGREFKIDDKACIAFASSFYTQLFSRHNSTICQAFDTAVAAVGTEFGKEGFAGEEHKFRCITDHKKEMCESYNMVIKHGYALDITPKVHFNELPDRVRGLVGRASD